ncbi:Cytochrome oxidase biogenesis protein Sco1/SenC/PrrC, thiol-disulfide reductase involved in Cu(I) insertion into CoxII Cu(A) center [hydrothermal vent metagenome]|uniref:Cytochrome oxidase biogenesis protein Sco1/SenC/PrrC, thiol-disulfide reductase involved in Cu(I) insertion into CoxII Cu(A) center n=1 Tax=hydrothermal vent metagenome TaxID=652676 RepID=A0A3B0Z4B7_9ZZZZ
MQQGTLLPTARPIAEFSLIDQKGAPFTLDSLKNHWTFTFFGYTQCPDVCPTSLAMLAQVIRLLEKDPAVGTLPRGLFVSVDPKRDTPDVLAQFIPYFHPDFIAATGSDEELHKLTRQLGLLYGKSEGDNENDYLMDHSAAIILFDPDGNYRALFNVPHDSKLIANEFVMIKDYYETTQ